MECPLCHTQHPLLVRGNVPTQENPAEYLEVEDRGYAFCNCRNIFYTDWINIDQRIYDEAYHAKYQTEKVSESFRNGFNHYLPILKQLKDIKTFCEIGSINPALLDEAKKAGYETTRLDINPASNDGDHKNIIGDIEDTRTLLHLSKYDCIWMSHLVEHLHYPLGALQNVRNLLTDDGLLFVSMPDPYFIDWNCPSSWGHWALREHHILWDLDSFIELMEEIDYELVYSKRYGVERSFVCVREFHTIFRRKKCPKHFS